MQCRIIRWSAGAGWSCQTSKYKNKRPIWNCNLAGIPLTSLVCTTVTFHWQEKLVSSLPTGSHWLLPSKTKAPIVYSCTFLGEGVNYKIDDFTDAQYIPPSFVSVATITMNQCAVRQQTFWYIHCLLFLCLVKTLRGCPRKNRPLDSDQIFDFHINSCTDRGLYTMGKSRVLLSPPLKIREISSSVSVTPDALKIRVAWRRDELNFGCLLPTKCVLKNS